MELGFALNTAVHSSLGVSPSFMNFGRNPTPSIILRTHLENPQPILPPDLEKWKSRSSRPPALHDLVRHQLDKATQAQYYNRKRREVYYQVGDLVRRRNHVLSFADDRFATKHAPKFVGLAKVIKVLSPVVYLVKDLNMNRTTKVHVNDLKHFVPPREPAVAQGENLNVSDLDEQPRREPDVPRAASPIVRSSKATTSPPAGDPPPARRRGRPRKPRTGRVGRPCLVQGPWI